MSGIKKFSVLTVAVALVLALTASPALAAKKKRAAARPMPDRSAEIVIEASTGYVLTEKNADKRLYPASLTKMMTLYLAFEAMEDGRLSKSQRIFVSRHAASQVPSSLGLDTGSSIRVEDAILGIATKSANDAAVTLAEAVGGSESGFARLMTRKARQLGMMNTSFVNASGLHNSSQYTTARDMALLSQALLRDYPREYRYFSTSSFYYNGVNNMNHNKLMASYRGMDGIKTGYIYASGYNLAASATRSGTRLIGVVFGGRTAKQRNDRMAKILDQGFADVGNVRSNRPDVAARKPRPVPMEEPQDDAPTVATSYYSDSVSDRTAQPLNPLDFAAVEQGDTEEGSRSVRIIRGQPPIPSAEPPSAKTSKQQSVSTPSPGGRWSIQIGAFSSKDAGMEALTGVRRLLTRSVSGIDMLAPLITNRGVVYRARIAGLSRAQATDSCRVIKKNCLVLSAP